MRIFVVKSCILSIFWILFGLGIQIVTKFWTLVGLELKFKNSGLNLDGKISQSAPSLIRSHMTQLDNAPMVLAHDVMSEA